MTDAADGEREVDFVLVEPEEEADAETGFVVVEDTDLVPAEDAAPTAPAVVEDAETGFVVRDPETEETGFVVRDPETEETGFVVVEDTDLVPAADVPGTVPATVDAVETDFVLVEAEDDAETDFVLVEDADVGRDAGLVPVDADSQALDTRGTNPKRNGHR